MLVHPLYDVFFTSELNYLNYKIVNILSKKNHADRKKVVAQIKKTLAIYGEQLLKTKQNPNALFVLVKPSFYREIDMVSNHYLNVPKDMPYYPFVEKMFSMYDKVMKRFYDFGNKQLKERFIVNDFDPFFNKQPFLPPELYSSLDTKNLTLKSFGEYISKRDGCVNSWSKYVNNHFKKKKINLKKIDIVSDKSFYMHAKPIDFYKGIYPSLLTGHKRKKLLGATSKQRKRVKKKLSPKILGKKIR